MFSFSQDVAVLRIGNENFQDCGIDICKFRHMRPCMLGTGMEIKTTHETRQ